MPIFGVDWPAVLLPGVPLLEIFVRGSIMYWALFLLMRFVIKREVGELGINDLLVVVLLADAAQNGMAGEYRSVPDGVLLVGIIAFWAYFIDWASFRFGSFESFARPSAELLVERGRILRRNAAKALISEAELFSLLRERGVESLEQVKSVRVEPDGKISVITYEGEPGEIQERKAR